MLRRYLHVKKDFSSFTDENFDLKAWINNALDQNKPPEESVEVCIRVQR